jgi:hypothetical protein
MAQDLADRIDLEFVEDQVISNVVFRPLKKRRDPDLAAITG